ncbi:MAG TPA: Do family serine endopeptidase [Caulobacteraceae bacterium]|jgi:serine protease Do|nr:Do family serine endopeptidase [Caulobacteraceae bacterium]
MQIKRKGFVAGAVMGAAVAGAALAGAGLHWPGAAADTKASLIKTSAPIFAPPPGAPLSFADIFQRVAPAVVSIDVTSKAQAPRAGVIPGLPPGFPFSLPGQPGGGDDGDEGDNSTGPRGNGQPQAPDAQATGSGFFITADGYIVTNNHVVENATSIKVRLTDQKELVGKLIGRDEATDLAVIKVEGRNYPFVNFENDGKPRVGDWVIAVGNPFNLGGTATAGIISAYGRDIGDNFVDYLQIDAPINRGNSGGPTFDVYGRVVGVNTAIFSPSGGSVGIGFAIPADIADSITKQLIAGGKVTRGYLGVTIQNVTPEIGESLGISAKSGALVNDVVSGGPADKGGVMSGDVVLNVNGKAITSASDLTRQVALAHAGQPIRLEVLRSGKHANLTVVSGVRPAEAQLTTNANGDDETQPNQPPRPQIDRTNVLGMGLVVLDDAARRRLSVKAGVNGVAIDQVAANSTAGKAGLRRGDVIMRVGDHPVTSPAEVKAAADAAQKAKRPLLLLISRNGRPQFLALKTVEDAAPAP